MKQEKQPAYLIFDVGKTNKKWLLFDPQGQVLLQESTVLPESQDEDGFPCEDLSALSSWVLNTYRKIIGREELKINGIHFAAYGASWVHLNQEGRPITPLYNYLKPFPEKLKDKFLKTYFNNNQNNFAVETASPFLGMLNSGLQLYWLKYEKPSLFKEIKNSLHLPQFLSFLLCGKKMSEYTSIGCHTGLWNPQTDNYHLWVHEENIETKLAPISTNIVVGSTLEGIPVGIGLHDSSSALIPYLKNNPEPFLLISTGTWCININPWNAAPLIVEELKQDCVAYLQFNGKPVKASRIFLGKEHEEETQKIASIFSVSPDFYKSKTFYENKDLLLAYENLMEKISRKLIAAIQLVLTPNIKTIYVDGGFSVNPFLLEHLKNAFPNREVQALDFAQATSLGAFLSLKEELDRKTVVTEK
jgi:sugar (pentulose or hexulose) kinase